MNVSVRIPTVASATFATRSVSRDMSAGEIKAALPAITDVRADALSAALRYIGVTADSQDIDDWSARRKIAVPAYVVWADLKALRAAVSA